jgi:eukaryotic-like serine/threonine-protein kinase
MPTADKPAPFGLAPGVIVDHYEIISLLGQGGEATVAKARDLKNDQIVVMKFFDPLRLGDVATYEHFRRAVAIGRLLKHPGIPQVLEVKEETSAPYIVMEYMTGESLRAIMTEDYQLSVRRFLKLGSAAAEVVAYCHQHGVFHRDLKPENLLVDENDNVKIIDFGIAVHRGANRVTWGSMSKPMGTPDYMAPEQVLGERGGAETDVYALGIMFYEMLTGYPPFVAPQPLVAMFQHLTHDPAPLNEVRKEVPEHIAAIVAKAIRRRKKERWADATQLLAALKNPDSVDVSILHEPDPPLNSPTVQQSIMKNPLLWLGMVAVVASVLTILLVVMFARH